jgi:LysM repeat protein
MTRSSIFLTLLKSSIAPATIGGFILLLSSCGHQAGGTIEVYETVGYQPNHGPFDNNGNYVEKWADSPPKRKYISRGKKKSAPKQAVEKPQYAAAAPKPVYATPKKASAPVPRKTTPVAVKPKKKSPITHTVKKGDTLYGLSRKYGTSVSSIQRANRLKGSNIGLGKKLIIPR